MLAFVKMFPAIGGGGMGVRMSLSEFQNRSFRALRRKPCPCRYFSRLCPYLALGRLLPFHPESSLCRCLKALSLVGFFL